MERYCYEPYEGRYHVFDRLRGMSTGGWNSEGMDTRRALASCRDADVAERIVRLLNADQQRIDDLIDSVSWTYEGARL